MAEKDDSEKKINQIDTKVGAIVLSSIDPEI